MPSTRKGFTPKLAKYVVDDNGDPRPVNHLGKSPGTKLADPRTLEFRGNPWDRQHHMRETSRAYSLFCIYRDLPPDERTVVAAMRQGGYKSDFYRWSAKFRWEERAAAFDTFTEQKRITAVRRKRIIAAERHAEKAEEIQLAMDPVIQKVADAAKNIDISEDMSPEDVVRLGQVAAKVILDAQRAEREALAPQTDEAPAQDASRIASRASKLRVLMANPQMVAMFEQMQMEVSAAEKDEQQKPA